MSPRKPSYSKTDTRYWLGRIFHRRFRQNGVEVVKPNYYVQIQFKGKRRRFHLETPNKALAGAKARDLYLLLLEGGWGAIDAKQNGGNPYDSDGLGKVAATVGGLIEVAQTVSSVRKTTFDNYARTFRKIASAIEGIEFVGGTYATNDELVAWKAKVDAIPLSKLTPERVLEWKASYIKSRSPETRQRAKTTLNTSIKNAKALFATKYLKTIGRRIDLPDPLPFEGVMMEKQPSSRYQSKIDAGFLLEEAERELQFDFPASYKIFLLGLMCGLRRSEIDTLLWSAFDFPNARLSVRPNAYTELKSTDSAGDIDLDPELNEIFFNYSKDSLSEFVIESRGKPRHSSRRVSTLTRSQSLPSRARLPLGVSKMHGRSPSLGSLTRFAKPTLPISPRPICAWRSRWDPSGLAESLQWMA